MQKSIQVNKNDSFSKIMFKLQKCMDEFIEEFNVIPDAIQLDKFCYDKLRKGYNEIKTYGNINDNFDNIYTILGMRLNPLLFDFDNKNYSIIIYKEIHEENF